MESRHEAYRQWVAAYRDPIHRRCVEVTQEMQQAFPELRVVRGVVRLDLTGTRDEGLPHSGEPHAWCVAPDGGVVDPTAAQWGLPIVRYDAAPEGVTYMERCPNCGERFYPEVTKTSGVCSERCHDEYVAYVNGA